MAKTEDYILRITGASPSELIVVSFDIMLDDLGRAVEAFGKDPEEFIVSVSVAKEALLGLIGALDMDNPVARELYPIYEYVNTLFLSALIYENREKVEEAMKILAILREGFVKAREQVPDEGAVYANAPKVYTGLTYGKDGLTDYVEQDPRRGIQV